MEHLWGQSSSVGLPMASTNAYTSVVEWKTWSWYLCPPAIDLQPVLDLAMISHVRLHAFINRLPVFPFGSLAYAFHLLSDVGLSQVVHLKAFDTHASVISIFACQSLRPGMLILSWNGS